MAKHKFKEGNSFGKGRPKDPPEIHAMKMLTAREFALLIEKVMRAKPEELSTFKGTVLEVWLASSIAKAIKTGDYNHLDKMLDRYIGKVVEKTEVDGAIKIIIEDYLKK